MHSHPTTTSTVASRNTPTTVLRTIVGICMLAGRLPVVCCWLSIALDGPVKLVFEGLIDGVGLVILDSVQLDGLTVTFTVFVLVLTVVHWDTAVTVGLMVELMVSLSAFVCVVGTVASVAVGVHSQKLFMIISILSSHSVLLL